MMAFQYLGILSYSQFTHNNGSLVGGALHYLAELDRRGGATPCLQFIVLADERIRRHVKELQVDEPAKFRDYAAALHEVLTAHAYIWGECRLEVASAPARGPAPRQPQAAATGRDDPATGATRRSKKNKARMKSDCAELRKCYKEGDRRQRSRDTAEGNLAGHHGGQQARRSQAQEGPRERVEPDCSSHSRAGESAENANSGIPLLAARTQIADGDHSCLLVWRQAPLGGPAFQSRREGDVIEQETDSANTDVADTMMRG